jgi:hypothetical protein
MKERIIKMPIALTVFMPMWFSILLIACNPTPQINNPQLEGDWKFTTSYNSSNPIWDLWQPATDTMPTTRRIHFIFNSQVGFQIKDTNELSGLPYTQFTYQNYKYSNDSIYVFSGAEQDYVFYKMLWIGNDTMIYCDPYLGSPYSYSYLIKQ